MSNPTPAIPAQAGKAERNKVLKFPLVGERALYFFAQFRGDDLVRVQAQIQAWLAFAPPNFSGP